jgi:hypothetical protein
VARDPTEKVRAAAEAVLVDGETVTSKGVCWAAQRRGRVPLPLLARRQYLLALTDRRVLVFERGRRPKPSDLVLGKRYETFTLERVRRGFPLLQVRVRSANGNQMVFEFRPGSRELGGELVARLTPRAPESAAVPDAPRPIQTLMDDHKHDSTTETATPSSTAHAEEADDRSDAHSETGSRLDAERDPVSPWAASTADDEPS